MVDPWDTSIFDETYIELDRNYRSQEENLRIALSLARLLKAKRSEEMLDVCCGYGRHLIPLVERGYRVCGVDLSSCMLSNLHRTAREKGLSPETHLADVRSMSFDPRFQCAYVAGSSFGVFADPEDDYRSLCSIRQSLLDKGRLLIDQSNPVPIMQCKSAYKNEISVRGEKIEEEVIPDPAAGCYEVHRRLKRGSWEYHFFMRFRYYDVDALSALLKRAGFERVRSFGDYDGKRYNPESPRMIVRARNVGN